MRPDREAWTWRRVITALLGSVMLAWFFGGMYLYPDAPLHPCASNGFCGKQGQPHSRLEFEHFMMWQSTLTWLWPTGMIVLAMLNWEKIQARQRLK
jgi:hypothetical protein